MYFQHYKTKRNCLRCNNNTKSIDSKKVTMTNKVIRAKSKCANCMAKNSRFLKQKHNKNSGW